MITYTMGWNYPGDTEAVFAAGSYLFGCCAGYITAEVAVTVTGSVFTGGAFLVARGALLLAKVGKIKKFINVLRRGFSWANAADGKSNAVARLFAGWFDVQRHLMEHVSGGENIVDRMSLNDDWQQTSGEILTQVTNLSEDSEFVGPMLGRMADVIPGATDDDVAKGLAGWLSIYGTNGRNIGTDAVFNAAILAESEGMGAVLIRLYKNKREAGDDGIGNLDLDFFGFDPATSKKIDGRGLPDELADETLELRDTLCRLHDLSDKGQRGAIKLAKGPDGQRRLAKLLNYEEGALPAGGIDLERVRKSFENLDDLSESALATVGSLTDDLPVRITVSSSVATNGSTAHMLGWLSSGSYSDSDLIHALDSVETLRANGGLPPGVLVPAPAGDGASALIVDLANGNRGHLFELVSAAEMIDRGVVPSGFFRAGSRISGKEADWEFLDADGNRWWIDAKYGSKAMVSDIIKIRDAIEALEFERAGWVTRNGESFGAASGTTDLADAIKDANDHLNSVFDPDIEYIRVMPFNGGDI